MIEEFLKRLPEHAREERGLIEAAFGIPQTLKSRAADIRGDAQLSETGKQNKIRALAAGSPLEHLKQIRSRAAAMKADVNNLRQAFKPKAPDRSDSYGELQRRELRDHLRTLPQAERFRMAMEDPTIMEAVLHAPHPVVAGLTNEQHDLFMEAYLDRTFGSQIRGVEQREEIIETVGAALEIATSQFRNESGLKDEDID
jgi:hypothetical protein